MFELNRLEKTVLFLGRIISNVRNFVFGTISGILRVLYEDRHELVAVGLIFGFAWWITMPRPQEGCYADESIFSLTLSQREEGHFFLGSGNVNEYPYYYFYERARDGLQGMVIAKSPAETTSIQETDDMAPIYRKFGFRRKGCSDCSCNIINRGTLFVPKGTVQLKFNADPESMH